MNLLVASANFSLAQLGEIFERRQEGTNLGCVIPACLGNQEDWGRQRFDRG